MLFHERRSRGEVRTAASPGGGLPLIAIRTASVVISRVVLVVYEVVSCSRRPQHGGVLWLDLAGHVGGGYWDA